MIRHEDLAHNISGTLKRLFEFLEVKDPNGAVAAQGIAISKRRWMRQVCYDKIFDIGEIN